MREWLEGNICRCTGYHNIVKAILAAAANMQGHARRRPSEGRTMAEKGIGVAVVRKEDQRFITGKGRYTDDINQHGQAYAYFVRSPHAHARITGIDKASAEGMPGVLAVLTGEDVKADGLGNLICGWMVKSKDGSPMKVGPHPLLAQDKARYVGDPVAVVVAETYQQAKDAGEALAGRLRRARRRWCTSATRTMPASLVHDEVANNLIYDWELGDKAATDAAFANAAHVTKIDLVNNRLVAQRDGAARRGRPLRHRRRQLHLLRHQPEPARPPAGHVGLHRRGARAQAARGGARRRRRLRLEDLHLQRGMRRHLGVEEGRRAAGEVDLPTASEAFLTDAHGRDHVSHAELAHRRAGQHPGACA